MIDGTRRRVVGRIVWFIAGGVASFALSLAFRAEPQPYDLHVFRSGSYELWVSVEGTSSWIPMAPYRYEVRRREICAESGNLCSPWRSVASFELDDPTRATDWVLKDLGAEVEIQFPTGIVVRGSGWSWRVLRTP